MQILMGCLAGLFAALVLVIIRLLLPSKPCPNCGKPLPKFGMPRPITARGGWFCPSCGSSGGRDGKIEFQAERQTANPHAQPEANISTSKICPQCAETIQLEALVCRFCGHQFTNTEVEAATQAFHEQALERKRLAQEKAELSAKQGKEKSRRNWGWVFAILGVLLALIGACFTVIFIFYTFSEEASKAMQTSGVMAVIAPFICSIPVLTIGVGLLLLGIKRLRAMPTITDKENLER